MSETPEYTGYDPRKPASKLMTLDDIVHMWRKEAEEKGLKAYNLGSGQSPVPGYVNVDVVDIPEVDMVMDLYADDWPIADSSAGVVYLCHFMEHVPDWNRFWKNLWRIAADECRVIVYGPWFMSNRYFQDPTHCQPLLDEKFAYLDRNWRVTNNLNHAYPDVNFVQEFDPFRDWNGRWGYATKEAQQYAMYHDRNVINDCAWFLKALKSPESTERMKKAQLKAMEI